MGGEQQHGGRFRAASVTCDFHASKNPKKERRRRRPPCSRRRAYPRHDKSASCDGYRRETRPDVARGRQTRAPGSPVFVHRRRRPYCVRAVYIIPSGRLRGPLRSVFSSSVSSARPDGRAASAVVGMERWGGERAGWKTNGRGTCLRQNGQLCFSRPSAIASEINYPRFCYFHIGRVRRVKNANSRVPRLLIW